MPGPDQAVNPQGAQSTPNAPPSPTVQETAVSVRLGSGAADDVVLAKDAGGRVGVQTLAGGSASIKAGAYTDANGNQLLGNRQAGWSASSNGARGGINASTATLAQVAAALAQLLADLATQGVIGP